MKKLTLSTVAFLLFAGTVQAGGIDLQMTMVADITGVVEIKHAGDGSGRIFLLQQTGQISILRNGTLEPDLFMDVRDLISLGNEQGLLSMAFSPDFANNGVFYLYFTDVQDRSNITRFRISQDDPDRGDIDSAEEIIRVIQPFDNHNGGRLEFGPDGFLYLGIGDGGGANDPLLAGQDLTTLLGKIIRIDVESSAQSYTVPADNPFVGQGGGVRDEIWAYGLRNPWRMTFDRDTGDLYIGDVGQESIEEVNFQSVSSGGGENYGWNSYEGSNCFNDPCDPAGKTFPVHEYDHGNNSCSITGGQVYRGPDYPALEGTYIYGDFCSGLIWGLTRQGNQFNNQLLLESPLRQLFTFGEDERGNIYVGGSAGFGESGVWLLSDGPPVQGETGTPINQGMSGAWFNPDTAGQGFLIDVEPASGFLFVAWFTYDDASTKVGVPEHRWLTAQGNYSGSEADISLFSTSGGAFDSSQATSTESVGTLNLEFSDCSNATATYDLPDDGLQGSISLIRVVPGTELLCESLNGSR